MKQIYIIFIFFGIVLFLYYNNCETLSIGGPSFVFREKSLTFTFANHDVSDYSRVYNMYEFNPVIQGNSITGLNELLILDNSIFYIGYFKIDSEGSITSMYKYRHIFIYLNSPDGKFYIVYGDITNGNIIDDNPATCYVRGKYRFANDLVNKILFNRGILRSDPYDYESQNNYISISLDRTISGQYRYLLILYDQNAENISKALHTLTYLSKTCNRANDCTNRGNPSVNATTDAGCICTCEGDYVGDSCGKKLCTRADNCNDRGDPRVGATDEDCGCTCEGDYVGDSCEKQLCTRANDCSNHGNPRVNATIDEDCGCICDDDYDGDNCRREKQLCNSEICNDLGTPLNIYDTNNDCNCDCFETCSCLDGGELIPDRDNCLLSESDGSPRLDPNGENCRWFTPSDNCLNIYTQDRYYLLIPGIKMKWGDGEMKRSWQKQIEISFSNMDRQTKIIDTTNYEWSIPSGNFAGVNNIPIMDDGLNIQTGVPNDYRHKVKSVYGLYERMYSALPELPNRSLTIYATVNGCAILFIILAKLKAENPLLLIKIKSVVLFCPAFSAGAIGYYVPNDYNNNEKFDYYHNEPFDYSFFDGINVAYIKNSQGYGSVSDEITHKLEDYVTVNRSGVDFLSNKIAVSNYDGDLDIDWKNESVKIHTLFTDQEIAVTIQNINTLYINIWAAIFEWSTYSGEDLSTIKTNVNNIEFELNIIVLSCNLYKSIYYNFITDHHFNSCEFKYKREAFMRATSYLLQKDKLQIPFFLNGNRFYYTIIHLLKNNDIHNLEIDTPELRPAYGNIPSQNSWGGHGKISCSDGLNQTCIAESAMSCWFKSQMFIWSERRESLRLPTYAGIIETKRYMKSKVDEKYWNFIDTLSGDILFQRNLLIFQPSDKYVTPWTELFEVSVSGLDYTPILATNDFGQGQRPTDLVTVLSHNHAVISRPNNNLCEVGHAQIRIFYHPADWNVTVILTEQQYNRINEYTEEKKRIDATCAPMIGAVGGEARRAVRGDPGGRPVMPPSGGVAGGGMAGGVTGCGQDIPTSVPSRILVRDDKYITINMWIKIRHYMEEYNHIFYRARVESINSATEFTVSYTPPITYPNDTYVINKKYSSLLNIRVNTPMGYRVNWKFIDD
tara:strand:+ start:174 stop:3548 length:3375 start_codon:yes stop_codon:yes gene_type:complete